MSIFSNVLKSWSGAEILDGKRIDKQINGVRLRYSSYLIATKKLDVDIACQLKSYKELSGDASGLSIENNKISVLLNPEIVMQSNETSLFLSKNVEPNIVEYLRRINNH